MALPDPRERMMTLGNNALDTYYRGDVLDDEVRSERDRIAKVLADNGHNAARIAELIESIASTVDTDTESGALAVPVDDMDMLRVALQHGLIELVVKTIHLQMIRHEFMHQWSQYRALRDTTEYLAPTPQPEIPRPLAALEKGLRGLFARLMGGEMPEGTVSMFTASVPTQAKTSDRPFCSEHFCHHWFEDECDDSCGGTPAPVLKEDGDE